MELISARCCAAEDVPGNFGFGAGVTPDPGLYLSSGIGYYGTIKVYIEGGKIVLDVVGRRPQGNCTPDTR